MTFAEDVGGGVPDALRPEDSFPQGKPCAYGSRNPSILVRPKWTVLWATLVTALLNPALVLLLGNSRFLHPEVMLTRMA